MGKQRHTGFGRGRAQRGLARLLAGSMVAGLLVTAGPIAGAPVAAAGGCIDKLEIETPAEKATTYGAVTLAAGETFRADIKHWTSAPNAATWLTGFNSEIRLSPMLDDGFPGHASTAQRDSFAADGPWDVDGFMNDGVFTYTNPSSSNVTSFVLEVGFWNHPANGIVGRTEASGFSTCVSPHTPPDRPTRDCPAAPTLVANGPNVWSEPFELKKNAYISMRMVDERPLRYNDAGEALPLLRSDYLIRTWLYGRSGPDDTWHYIRRDSHRSQNNWLRGSYVGSWDISIKNRSDYTEVMVIFGKWISRGYALSTPLDVSIKDPGQPWRSTCLTSTQTTVTWDAAPSCAADDTARMQATVTNKSGRLAGYRVSLLDPTSGTEIHSSLYNYLDANETGTLRLGGIPTGAWRMRVYELQADGSEAAVGSSPVSTFDSDSCPLEDMTSATWASEPHCAADRTLAIGVLVTNQNDRSVSYQIDVIDMATASRIHSSDAVEVASGASQYLTLGGIPTGTWYLQLSEDGVAVPGSGWAQTFGLNECPLSNSTAAAWDAAPHCAADGSLAIGVLVTNQNDRSVSYQIDVIDMATESRVLSSEAFDVASGASRYVTFGGVPLGTWYLQLSEDGLAVPGTGWAQTFARCEPQGGTPDCPALDRAIARVPITTRVYNRAVDDRFGIYEWGQHFESTSTLFADGTRVIRAEESDRDAFSVEPGIDVYRFLEAKGGYELEHVTRSGSLYVFGPEADTELHAAGALYLYTLAQSNIEFHSRMAEYVRELNPEMSEPLVWQTAGVWVDLFYDFVWGEPQTYSNTTWGSKLSLSATGDLSALASKSPIDGFGFLPDDGKISLQGALSDSQQIGDIALARSVRPSTAGDPSVVTTLSGKITAGLAFDLFGLVNFGSELQMAVKVKIYQGLSEPRDPGATGALPIDRVTLEFQVSGDVGAQFDLANVVGSWKEYLVQRTEFTAAELAGLDQLKNAVSVSTGSRDGVQARIKFTIYEPGAVAETLLAGDPAAVLAEFAALSASNPDAWKLTVEASEFEIEKDGLGFDLASVMRLDLNLGTSYSESIRRDRLIGAHVITACGSEFVDLP